MKKTILLMGICAEILIATVTTSVYADTIFTGQPGTGVVQLRENLQVGAISNLGEGATHLAISGTSHLYCATSNKISILNPRTLAKMRTINLPGDVRAMELKNGYLYALVGGSPAKVLVISDSTYEITKQIEVGTNPSDMAVASDGCKLYVAKSLESKIDIVPTEGSNTGYGNTGYGYKEDSISIVGNPCSVVLNSDGSKLFAVDRESSRVIVIDTRYNKVLKRIQVGRNCVKLRPAGSNIYAIDRSPANKAVYVINGSSATVTDVIELDTVPYDAACHPSGNYSVIVSRAGNRAYKVEGARVVAEKPLPGPQSILITSSTFGTMGVVYSAGSQLQNDININSDYSVMVLVPQGPLEKWNGTNRVWWQITPEPIYYYSYISSLVGGQEHYIGVVQSPETWFDWDTSKLGPDSQQCKIKIYVRETPGEPSSSDPHDTSDYFFTVDNTPPEVEITYPPKHGGDLTTPSVITVMATATDNMTGIKDENLSTPDPDIILTVNDGGIIYATDSTRDGTYVANDVILAGGGAQNVVKVTAQDETTNNIGEGNKGIDELSAFVGWVTHIELPRSVPYEINYNSSGAASSQIILDVMKEGKIIDLVMQAEIYEYGHSFNRDGSMMELGPKGIDAALCYFDPWDPAPIEPYGDHSKGYNFNVNIRPSDQYNNYLKNIAHWIAYTVPIDHYNHGLGLVVAPHAPAAVPIYGDFNWVVVNGVATDNDPYAGDPLATPWDVQDFTLYGMWMTDPEVGGIGQDRYIGSAELGTYIQPINRPDDYYNGKYVTVVEPPEKDTTNKLEISQPVVNESTLALVEIAEHFNSASDPFKRHLVDSALMVDLEDAKPLIHYSLDGDLLNLFKPEKVEGPYSICWKEIIAPPLLSDKDFRAAIDGAIARNFLYVERLDNGQEYILIPFDKFAQGRFLSYAAIIVDKQLGYFKEASCVDKPARYVQLTKKEAIEAVIKAYPEAEAKEPDARLVWEPGGMTLSPFYPYWEVTAGSKKYHVVYNK